MNFTKLIIFLTIILLPSFAYANGGGPILLYINFAAFVFGQVWILSVETYMYSKWLKINPATAFRQVFHVNFISTLLIGLGLPFLLAIITGFAMNLPNPLGEIMSLLGTWVYESAPYMSYIWFVTGAWFIITLYLTVICERWYITKIWNKAGFICPVNINTFIWQVHAVSYTGLILAFIAFALANGLTV